MMKLYEKGIFVVIGYLNLVIIKMICWVLFYLIVNYGERIVLLY